MSDLRPCSATDHQSGSDQVCKPRKHCSILKKLYLLLIYYNVQTYDHWPHNKPDHNEAETDVCT